IWQPQWRWCAADDGCGDDVDMDGGPDLVAMVMMVLALVATRLMCGGCDEVGSKGGCEGGQWLLLFEVRVASAAEEVIVMVAEW
ncbi:hypothetical protein Tco_0586129, partial [Tanacetum coccineum]